jgi:hypothetical protein
MIDHPAPLPSIKAWALFLKILIALLVLADKARTSADIISRAKRGAVPPSENLVQHGLTMASGCRLWPKKAWGTLWRLTLAA